MRISSLALLAGSAALLFAGCNSSQSQAPAVSESTTSTSSNLTTATPEGEKTDAGAQAKTDTGAQGKSDAGAPAASATTADPVPTPLPTPTVTTTESDEEPPHELVAGIKNANLVRQFATMHKAASEKPTDWRVQIQYINLLQSIGQERIKANETEKAYSTFAAAGDVARQFLASKTEFPESVHNRLAIAFYNDACALSRGNDPKKALVSLEEAIKWGFADFALMEKDEDLVSLRASADFTQKLDGWRKLAREKALKQAKDDLAAGESFSFDFALTDVDGKPIKLADYKGKVVIVDIWGTWCPPCRAEIPSFVKLQETFGEKGFQIVGLNKENKSGDEGVQLVKTFMADQKMNYPCALIDKATQDQVPKFEGYPTTLFIDRTGKVRLKVVGLHEYSYLEAIVLTLLEEPAAPANVQAAS